MLIKQPLLKKSQTINLGRSPFTKEEKAKLLLEINKRQSDEVNIEYRKSGDSKSNQSNSDQSLVEKDQGKFLSFFSLYLGCVLYFNSYSKRSNERKD